MESSDRSNAHQSAAGDASHAFADELFADNAKKPSPVRQEVAMTQTPPSGTGQNPNNDAAHNEYRGIVEDMTYRAEPQHDPNFAKLAHLYDDRIHNNHDAVAYAAQAVKFFGDRFTEVELDPAKFSAGTVGLDVKQAPDGDPMHGSDNKAVAADALQTINGVKADSAAAKAGLSSGDQILAIDGIDMHGRTPLEVQTLLDGAQGTSVDLTVSHNGKSKNVRLDRTEAPGDPVDGPDGKSGRLGVVVGFLGQDSKHLSNHTDGIKANTDTDAATAKPNDLIAWSVVPGSAADQAGMHRGDIIRKIDGKPVAGETFDQVLGQLRGDNGQGVDLTVLRQGKEQTLHATRSLLNVDDVQTRDMGSGIEYVSMNNFSDTSGAPQLRKVFEANPNAKAFVLDLRNNPGGRVEQAVSTLELMVKQGTLYTERERQSSPPGHAEYEVTKRTVDDTNVSNVMNVDGQDFPNSRKRDMPYLLNGRPVVVLTNGQTASAAELVTGGLHDNKVATTLGETTYGKGIGQTEIHGIDNANPYQEKMTNFTWSTPNGTWAGDASGNRKGLKADVEVADDLPAGDPQLDAAVNLLKDKIK